MTFYLALAGELAVACVLLLMVCGQASDRVAEHGRVVAGRRRQ